MLDKYIQNHPNSGVMFPTIGVVLMWLVDLLTNDITMKVISVSGALLGCVVAILSICIKVMEWKEKRIKIRRLNDEQEDY